MARKTDLVDDEPDHQVSEIFRVQNACSVRLPAGVEWRFHRGTQIGWHTVNDMFGCSDIAAARRTSRAALQQVFAFRPEFFPVNYC